MTAETQHQQTKGDVLIINAFIPKINSVILQAAMEVKIAAPLQTNSIVTNFKIQKGVVDILVTTVIIIVMITLKAMMI